MLKKNLKNQKIKAKELRNKKLSLQKEEKELNEIKNKLKVERDFLEESIIALYQNQTAKERESGFTIFRNGKGFNKADSFRLSEAGLLLIKGNHLKGVFLRNARKRMMKYAKQLKAEGILELN